MPASARSVVAFLCLSALCLLASGGCACVPTAAERQVVVSLDDALVGTPVVVSLNGVTAGELNIWKTYSVDDFFGPQNQLRSGIAKDGELVFDVAKSERVKVLQPDDAAWKRWKEQGATELVVMAYIPGLSNPPAGSAAGDPRRQVVPLSQCLWANPQEPIRLQVGANGVTVQSQPLATPR